MTVKDLIQKLEAFPPWTVVVICDADTWDRLNVQDVRAGNPGPSEPPFVELCGYYDDRFGG